MGIVVHHSSLIPSKSVLFVCIVKQECYFWSVSNEWVDKRKLLLETFNTFLMFFLRSLYKAWLKAQNTIVVIWDFTVL